MGMAAPAFLLGELGSCPRSPVSPVAGGEVSPSPVDPGVPALFLAPCRRDMGICEQGAGTQTSSAGLVTGPRSTELSVEHFLGSLGRCSEEGPGEAGPGPLGTCTSKQAAGKHQGPWKRCYGDCRGQARRWTGKCVRVGTPQGTAGRQESRADVFTDRPSPTHQVPLSQVLGAQGRLRTILT